MTSEYVIQLFLLPTNCKCYLSYPDICYHSLNTMSKVKGRGFPGVFDVLKTCIESIILNRLVYLKKKRSNDMGSGMAIGSL